MVGAAIAVAACVALLASCSLLPPGVSSLSLDTDNQRANTEMQQIISAVHDRDASALKALFSKRARENALDLDSGLRYFLSVFPSGLKNLGEPDGGPGGSVETDYGKETDLINGNFEVSANGKKYLVSFDYFAVNQIEDPENVGLYDLGVVPYNAKPYTNPTASSDAFFTWTSQFDGVTSGSPGVYVPDPRFAAAYQIPRN